MTFLAAAVAVLAVLLGVLLATCAHLLSRIMRLEAVEHSRAAAEVVAGVDELRVGTVVPPWLVEELGVDGLRRRAALHVVSAGCSNCRRHVEALCRDRAPSRGPMHRVVVGHDADFALLPLGCTTRAVVSAAFVQLTVMSGWALPVTVVLEDGAVVAIETHEHERAHGE